MEPTDAEVERAFHEWCALMGVRPPLATAPGRFRLARVGTGRVQVEQVVGEAGEIRAIAAPMTPREFCDAVHFVHESMNLKTVQVARSIARKRRPRP